MDAAVFLQTRISPLICFLREAEQRPPVVLDIQAHLDHLHTIAESILSNRGVQKNQISAQLFGIISLLEASPLNSVEQSSRDISTLTQAYAEQTALESFSREIGAKTRALSSSAPAPVGDGGTRARACAGLPGTTEPAPAGNPAEDPDLVGHLHLTGNRQLGRGSLTVGIEVHGKRRRGGRPLRQVMRNARLLDNWRGDPRRPKRQAGRMVVGGEFRGGAEAEELAGTFRGNRNYDDGRMVVGLCFD